jgi:pimeloyl-ACP methyl ester carboxylesterase
MEPASIARIGAFLGQPVHWRTLDEAADALWALSLGFGPHTREQWLALSRPQLKADGDGFKPHYDPGIAVPFRSQNADTARTNEALLWQAYDRLKCQVLLLRGAESDLLSHATAQAMTQRGPRARVVEFAGVGHAPMLVQPDQRAVVRDFLLAP